VQHNIPTSFIHDINLFADYGASPPLHLPQDTFNKICNFCEEIIAMQNTYHKYSSDAISAYLKLILITCHQSNAQKSIKHNEMEAGETLLRNFKKLVDHNYKHWHSVKDYGNALYVSADHLNKVVKSLIGKTAKEYIQNRLIIAAKRLLFHTNSSTKEIAFELGFNEPAHFSHFFKKCTSHSPTAFRKTMQP